MSAFRKSNLEVKVTDKKVSILVPGVPSHFFGNRSIRLQNVSTAIRVVCITTFQESDPEVIGQDHGARNHVNQHSWGVGNIEMAEFNQFGRYQLKLRSVKCNCKLQCKQQLPA